MHEAVTKIKVLLARLHQSMQHAADHASSSSSTSDVAAASMPATKAPDEDAERRALAAAEALLGEEEAEKAACRQKQEQAQKRRNKKTKPSQHRPAGCSTISSEEALAGQLSDSLLSSLSWDTQFGGYLYGSLSSCTYRNVQLHMNARCFSKGQPASQLFRLPSGILTLNVVVQDSDLTP